MLFDIHTHAFHPKIAHKAVAQIAAIYQAINGYRRISGARHARHRD